jgi:hypothetical protein
VIAPPSHLSRRSSRIVPSVAAIVCAPSLSLDLFCLVSFAFVVARSDWDTSVRSARPSLAIADGAPINRRADVSVPHTYTQIHIYCISHHTRRPTDRRPSRAILLPVFLCLLFTLDMERPPVGRWFASACVCVCVCVCASLSLWPSACPCGVGLGY